jgi:hypothetical protein
MSLTITKIFGLLNLFLFWTRKKKARQLHVIDLARVMARFEGYYTQGTRAQRNKNPLNLKWSKFTNFYDDGNFCIFETVEDGWKAGLWDLEMKCKGYTRTGLKPTSTVRNLIYVWSATDQEAYLRYVCQKLKIPFDYQLKCFSLKQINLTLKQYLDEGKI